MLGNRYDGRANFTVFVYGTLFIPTSRPVFGYAGQGVGKEFGHGSFLFFPAPEDKILSGTGEGYIQQVQVIYPQLQAFVQIVCTVYGLCHCGGIVHRHQADGIIRFFRRDTPYQLVVGLVFQLPVAEGNQYGMEFQSFGFVDGEYAYTVRFTTGNGFAAKGFVPVADEAGQFGRIALQILRHSIEEGEEVGILLFNAAHAEDAEQFFQ